MGAIEHYRDFLEANQRRMADGRQRLERFVANATQRVIDLDTRIYVTHRRLTWNERRAEVARSFATAHSKRSRRKEGR